jgi:thiol:disulfide interchange protein DsbC
MKIGRLLLAAGLLWVSVTCAFAAEEEAAARSAFSALFEDFSVKEVRKSPVAGLYEITVEEGILYFAPESGIVIEGSMYSGEGENLTKLALLRQLTLAKERAIKVGSGPVEVIEVTDPDCGFCRKMHAYWQTRTDVTRYVFLMPIADLHPEAEQKSRYILCASDRVQALEKVFAGDLDGNRRLLTKDYDDGGELAALAELAAAAGVSGTPAYLVDGHYVGGADLEKIEALLAAARPRS